MQVWVAGPPQTSGLTPPRSRMARPICPQSNTPAVLLPLAPSQYPLRTGAPNLPALTLYLQMLYTGIVIYAPALILNQGLNGRGWGGWWREGAKA